jgi:hypothetical protein
LLRFAPAYDPQIITDPKLARSLVVERGALERVRRAEPLPVVVDHDREIGTVSEIFVAPTSSTAASSQTFTSRPSISTTPQNG